MNGSRVITKQALSDLLKTKKRLILLMLKIVTDGLMNLSKAQNLTLRKMVELLV
jgi:hypothetical protein